MKKKLLLMAIALLGITGFSASAQQTRDNNATREASAPQNKMRQPREFTEFAFEGILLDINQQQRMDSLNAAVKAQRPGPRGERQCCKADSASQNTDCCKKADCSKAQCDQAQCADSTQCKAKGKECRLGDSKRSPKGQRMMMRNPYGEEYVAKVKEILTPDQFEIFQENISNMPMMRQAGAMKNGAKGAVMSRSHKAKGDKKKADRLNGGNR